jgi:hypothetical protein
MKWLLDNKEWIFSGLGISIVTIIFSIVKYLKTKSKNENTNSSYNQINNLKNSQINNLTNAQINNLNINSNSTPKLIIKCEKPECNLYYPEIYNNINTHKSIMNYSSTHLQQLVLELQLFLNNIGNDCARNINITFKINKKDVLLTDKNILWLSMSLPLETVNAEEDENYYIQYYSIATMEPHEKICLPLNQTLNGIIISSLFNIEHVTSFEKSDFSINSDNYKNILNKKSCESPILLADIKYYDLNNAMHKESLCLEFNVKYIQLGNSLGIEVKEKFES